MQHTKNKHIKSIIEITNIKRYLIIILSLYNIIALSLSSSYNYVLGEEKIEHFYLSILQGFLIILSIYGLSFAYYRKKLLASSYIVLFATFAATFGAVIGGEGNFNTYIFVIMFGIIAFALLEIRSALIVYSLYVIIDFYMAYFVYDTRPETLFNLISATTLSGVALYAFALVHKSTTNKLALTSRIDELTGLWNRKMFNEVWKKEIAISNRNKSPITIMIGDIDNFKKVNDTYGHDVGDVILKSVSKILLSQIRESDVLFRWGGEEFAFIFPNTNGEDSMKVANKVLLALRNITHDQVGNVTMSFGLSSYILDESYDNVFVRADKALYKSKNNGKDQYTLQ